MTMKRVKVTAIVQDDINKETFEWAIKGAGQIESYTEKDIPKDHDVLEEHSFEALWESTLLFGNGIWSAVKGFFGMAKFAVIMIIEGLRWLWKEGLGNEKKKTPRGEGGAKNGKSTVEKGGTKNGKSN